MAGGRSSRGRPASSGARGGALAGVAQPVGAVDDQAGVALGGGIEQRPPGRGVGRPGLQREPRLEQSAASPAAPRSGSAPRSAVSPLPSKASQPPVVIVGAEAAAERGDQPLLDVLGITPPVQARRAASRASPPRPLRLQSESVLGMAARGQRREGGEEAMTSPGDAASRASFCSAVRRIAASPGQPRWPARKEA